MEAIILAGGLGKRLQEIVADVPKPMAPIAGRPFLEILLTSLARKGFRRTILSLGYMAQAIVEHFGDKFLEIDLVYEIEKKPLGTGGAVRVALAHCAGDHAFIFNGDTYLDLEVDEVERTWALHKLPIVVVREVADTARFGRLEVCTHKVVRFNEKSTAGPGFINAGCYVFPRDILDAYPRYQPFSLERDFLAKAVERQQFRAYVTNGYFIDIGIPEDYERAQREFTTMLPT